jgi:hypothetical protein
MTALTEGDGKYALDPGRFDETRICEVALARHYTRLEAVFMDADGDALTIRPPSTARRPSASAFQLYARWAGVYQLDSQLATVRNVAGLFRCCR